MKNWKGDTSLPVASICTRTYNLENFVHEALDSFLIQETDFPFEVVVDDDYSSDETAEVIKKYMAKFPNIIKAYLREKNVGLRVNFVENMQRAKGKYIALCDGDDYWNDPLKLQKQVDFLEENDEYVLTYTAMETFYEKGMIERNVICGTGDKESLEIQKHLLGTGSCTVCFRNLDIIKNYPFEYHCSPSNDHFLWSLLGGYGKGKFLKDIKAVRYRQHRGGDYAGKTVAARNTLHHQTDYALYMYYLRIGNIPLSEYYHNQVVRYSIVERGRWYYVKIILRGAIGEALYRVKRIFK
jgi:glycosyltransferase involved in cell wall biosynthesis